MAEMPPVNVEKYTCIYPAYLNSKKTLAEGRRIPKSGGCENPTYSEIKDVCVAAGLHALSENKVYPREMYMSDVMFRGRIRVKLRNEDGSLVDERFPNKKSLLLHVGEMIPKLKTRTAKSSASDAQASQSQGGKSKKPKRKKR